MDSRNRFSRKAATRAPGGATPPQKLLMRRMFHQCTQEALPTLPGHSGLWGDLLAGTGGPIYACEMRAARDPETSLRSHWEAIFASKDPAQVSWYQREAGDSLEMIEKLGVSPVAPVIDVGGGESRLVDGLLARDFSDVSVLDISERALSMARKRLGAEKAVTWLHEDLLQWTPPRTFALWHDRAVFHFFTNESDRQRYLEVLNRATAPGSHVIIATFAPEGPDHCSSLPVSRYDPKDLADMLGADFDPLITQHREHLTPRGVIQPFSWLAARKLGVEPGET